MDFADSPEHAAFRAEFRHWLEANLPPEICVDDAADQRVAPDRETLEKRIAQRGPGACEPCSFVDGAACRRPAAQTGIASGSGPVNGGGPVSSERGWFASIAS